MRHRCLFAACVLAMVWALPCWAVLVAGWGFDESSGTVAQGVGPGGVNGTLRNGASFGPGIIRNAVQLDGTDDYVDFGGVPSAVGSLGQGSVSTWFRFSRTTGEAEILPVLYIGDGVGGAGHSAALVEVGHFEPNDTKLYFTFIHDDMKLPLCFDSGENLQPGQWYHFVGVVGPDGNTGYLNGEELTGRHYNFGDASSVIFLDDIADQRVMWVGRGLLARSPEEQYFDGQIDEIGIYNTPLTAEQVRALYEAGIGPDDNEPPTPGAVPEPLTLVLAGVAGAAVAAKLRRRTRGVVS